MNVHPPREFARFDGLDALAGYDDAPELAGIGKKLKKARRKLTKVARKVSGVHLVKKALPKKAYGKIRKVGQKAEKFAKRNGVAIAGAVATVATGGAAAPAMIAAMKSMAASETMRKVAQKRGKKKLKKATAKANDQINQQAAQYEADLERQDAAAAAADNAGPESTAPQWAGTGGGGGASQQPATDTPDTNPDAPKRSAWILPALGIGAAALAFV